MVAANPVANTPIDVGIDNCVKFTYSRNEGSPCSEATAVISNTSNAAVYTNDQEIMITLPGNRTEVMLVTEPETKTDGRRSQTTLHLRSKQGELLNYSPQKEHRFISCTEAEKIELFATWPKDLKKLPFIPKIKTYSTTYGGDCDEFGVHGWTSKDIIKTMCDWKNVRVNCTCSEFWVKMFTISENETIYEAIQKLLNVFKPIYFWTGNTLNIMSFPDTQTQHGRVRITKATSDEEILPRFEKPLYVRLEGGDGQFKRSKFQGEVYEPVYTHRNVTMTGESIRIEAVTSTVNGEHYIEEGTRSMNGGSDHLIYRRLNRDIFGAASSCYYSQEQVWRMVKPSTKSGNSDYSGSEWFLDSTTTTINRHDYEDGEDWESPLLNSFFVTDEDPWVTLTITGYDMPYSTAAQTWGRKFVECAEVIKKYQYISNGLICSRAGTTCGYQSFDNKSSPKTCNGRYSGCSGSRTTCNHNRGRSFGFRHCEGLSILPKGSLISEQTLRYAIVVSPEPENIAELLPYQPRFELSRMNESDLSTEYQIPGAVEKWRQLVRPECLVEATTRRYVVSGKSCREEISGFYLDSQSGRVMAYPGIVNDIPVERVPSFPLRRRTMQVYHHSGHSTTSTLEGDTTKAPGLTVFCPYIIDWTDVVDVHATIRSKVTKAPILRNMTVAGSPYLVPGTPTKWENVLVGGKYMLPNRTNVEKPRITGYQLDILPQEARMEVGLSIEGSLGA